MKSSALKTPIEVFITATGFAANAAPLIASTAT
jgi:hypothetical protein